MDHALATATPPEHPIDLLTVDLMFTVLELDDGVSPRRFKADLYRNYGRLLDDSEEGSPPLSMTDDQVHALVDELRHRFKEIRTDKEFFYIVNLFWYQAVLANDLRRRQHADKYAARVRATLLERRESYRVRPAMVDMLRLMRRQGVRVVVLSNQDAEPARRHIRSFEMEDAFDAVYTSEDIGWMKPHAQAWTEVVARESDIVGHPILPERIAHLGNSVNSDTGAARIGIPVMLYDRYGDLRSLSTGDLAGLSIPQVDPRELHRWWEQGLVTVHPSIASLREHLLSRLALRATA